MLSANTAALHLLEARPSEVDWEMLSWNDGIFVPNEPELVAALRLLALEFS
jgi:hypothetical protein